MNLLEQRISTLAQQETVLRAEFVHWKARAAKGEPLEKHNSQMERIVAQLEKFLETLQSSAAHSTPSFAAAEHTYTWLLGAHRIWAYFRSKLAMRDVDWLRDDLNTADELAWDCYKPIWDAAKAAGTLKLDELKEPPLVFFSNEPAPFMQARSTFFRPEGLSKRDSLQFDEAVLSLPFPIIALPWFHVDHLPTAVLVSHEVGHAVERDFRLAEPLETAFTDLALDPDHRPAWMAWHKEIFADVYGVICTGRAYILALMSYLTGDPDAVQQERIDGPKWGDYPTDYLRILICLEALDQLAPEADRDEWLASYHTPLEKAWTEAYAYHEMTDYEDEIPQVVGTILLTRWKTLGGKTLPAALNSLDEKEIEKFANRVLNNIALPKNEAFRSLFAGVAVAYARDVSKYSDSNERSNIARRLKRLIPKGVRSAKERLTKEEKKKQQQADEQAGATLFGIFAPPEPAPEDPDDTESES